jgi:arylsulfatase A-like enzyme
VTRLRPLALGLAALALASCAPERPRPPRGILVLLVDAMRADRLGLAGSPVDATPSLDALGPESVVFRNAFAQATWTRPSVPTLLSGLYPSEHGLTDFVASGNRVEGRVLAPAVTTLAEGMQAAGYRTAMVGYQAQLSPRFGMDQGFDFFNNNTMGGAKIRNRFLGWLDEAPDQPFFAYLHFLDIHWPYCPPAETYGKLGPEGAIRLCESWRHLREEIRAGRVTFDDAEQRALAARYAEELLALDGELGALFAALRERGVWDDVLVVVTSDHGEELAERGGIEHGHTMYDELMRVPFLWRLPPAWQVAGGRTDDTLVEIRALLPTLFDLVGQPVPPEVTAPSLLPWVLGRPPAEPPFRYVAAESNGIFAVRTERWKLVLTPAEKRTELYDLAADPGERTDLAGARPAELATLQRDLRRWLKGMRPAGGGTTALDDETAAELRSLGYLQ